MPFIDIVHLPYGYTGFDSTHGIDQRSSVHMIIGYNTGHAMHMDDGIDVWRGEGVGKEQFVGGASLIEWYRKVVVADAAGKVIST